MDKIEERYENLIKSYRTLSQKNRKNIKEMLSSFLASPDYSLINSVMYEMQNYEDNAEKLKKFVHLLRHYRVTAKD